ncbi:MAG: iron chelate uptake ABC transporter family permease subunit, partial [Salinivirgaceae bacterium]|nr:iron chelate uptake ABC transporter family permease subunit [Salinivirgaceae bacterium]
MKVRYIYIILSLLLAVLAVLNIVLGSVRIPLAAIFDMLMGGNGGNPTWQVIVMQSRVPQCVTALFCGAALSAAGLMLQTTLANPLAGPSILGITSGSSLGVAIVALT